jgi:hypothetical protein
MLPSSVRGPVGVGFGSAPGGRATVTISHGRSPGRLRPATPVATPVRIRLAFRLAVAVATGVSAHLVKVLGRTPVLVLRGLIMLTEDAFAPSSRDHRSQN